MAMDRIPEWKLGKGLSQPLGRSLPLKPPPRKEEYYSKEKRTTQTSPVSPPSDPSTPPPTHTLWCPHEKTTLSNPPSTKPSHVGATTHNLTWYSCRLCTSTSRVLQKGPCIPVSSCHHSNPSPQHSGHRPVHRFSYPSHISRSGTIAFPSTIAPPSLRHPAPYDYSSAPPMRKLSVSQPIAVTESVKTVTGPVESDRARAIASISVSAEAKCRPSAVHDIGSSSGLYPSSLRPSIIHD